MVSSPESEKIKLNRGHSKVTPAEKFWVQYRVLISGTYYTIVDT